MNLEDAKIGFYSGEAANSVDFRHTFSEDNQTHYYVCEPHATMGMVGTVTVGAGSEGDRIPEVLEDSGLPNVSFMVGALVLVGAAGLRRRIH
jgi:MYXO-CTERM domain-containing protein